MAQSETTSCSQPAPDRRSPRAIERDEALTSLRTRLKPGTTVYTILRHRSASGMSRLIDLYVIEGGEPLRLTWDVAKALDYSYSREKEALRVRGCGMDMGYHLVHNLSRALFKDGYCLRHRWL